MKLETVTVCSDRMCLALPHVFPNFFALAMHSAFVNICEKVGPCLSSFYRSAGGLVLLSI